MSEWMRGFVGVCGIKTNDHFPDMGYSADKWCSENPSVEKLVFPGGWLARIPPTRFQGDRLFCREGDLSICTEGVLLNSKRLRDTWAAKDNKNLLIGMWRTRGEKFLSELRGEFSGVLVDSAAKRNLIFSSHFGGVPLYYYLDKRSGAVLLSTDLLALSRLMQQGGLSPRLNEDAALCMLSFGYMLGSQTLISGVKRLSPGTVGIHEDSGFSLCNYHTFQNQPDSSSVKQIKEGLTERFTLAVRDEWEKDLEYGYGHVATLSGGLDSRANVLKARNLGFPLPLLLCMSVSGYLDETISKSIADDSDSPHLAHSLGRGGYLTNVDEPIIRNGGLVAFDGSAHLLRLLGLVRLDNRGLLHTGMLGDAVMGSYLSAECHVKQDCFAGTELLPPLEASRSIAEAEWNKFDNDELFLFRNRGVNGVLNGYWTASRYIDCASPFMHADFMDFALRIDPRFRYRQRLYREWLAFAIPDTGRFAWEATGARPSASEIFGLTRRVIRGIRRRVIGEWRHYSMNPMNYWFRTNPMIQTAWRASFEEGMEAFSASPAIVSTTRAVFESRGMRGMVHALTLVRGTRILHLH